MARKHSLVLAAACLAAVNLAQAQAVSYPTRPIRMIVPFAPGGASDFVAEIVTSRSPEDFAGFMKTQNAFWAKIVKDVGAVAE
jgi:tripartite-type tricarboxylate transporter receptor subunit TctC